MKPKTKNRRDPGLLAIVKPPADLVFTDRLSLATSIYAEKLSQALSSQSAISIPKADFYVRTQFVQAGKKLHLRLLFAIKGETLFIKPAAPSIDENRLVLLLREPRTVPFLEQQKLDIDLKTSLARLLSELKVHQKGDKWVLTEKGFDSLAESRKPDRPGDRLMPG